MQPEHLSEVVAGADDRPDDGDALQDGVEDRDSHGAVRRQRDADQPPTAPQGTECLLERTGRGRERDSDVRPTKLGDLLRRVGGRRVHHVIGSELGCQGQLGLGDVHPDDETAGDTGVLQRQMAQPTDAEDGNGLRR